MIYLCSPNNPTRHHRLNRAALQSGWDYANETGAVILFDAAYEAFITQEDVPHTIYEIPGAKTCAIEFHSFSKTAAYRQPLRYTVVPRS